MKDPEQQKVQLIGKYPNDREPDFLLDPNFDVLKVKENERQENDHRLELVQPIGPFSNTPRELPWALLQVALIHHGNPSTDFLKIEQEITDLVDNTILHLVAKAFTNDDN